MTSDAREVETTLRPAAGEAGGLASAVAGLEEVAGYGFRPREPVVLEDVYLDTPGGALEAAGLALRLRRREGEWIAGLKGDERRLADGSTSRLEEERRWSAEAGSGIEDLLISRGIEPPAERPGEGDGPGSPGCGSVRRGVEGPEESGPVRALAELGLEVVQRRTTRRRRRRIVAPGTDEVVGELAVDRVAYQLRAGEGRTVVHREVEVEGRSERAEEVVSDVRRALLRRFGEALRPWRHNKLATGKALERLSERGELADLTGPDGALTEEGYARLEEMLGEPPG